ncbi:MAG: DHH family phosphoesterase, partial [Deltaproteobacteria bacterium]|nr:DHH family phosphoesterase [Deltaproteobacteria bacterium]
MIWKHRDEADRAAALELARALGKPVKYTQLLLGRGFRTHTEIRGFIAPELRRLPLPETMPNMLRAVEAFLRARERGDTVAVAGDYDADGLTATAVLVRVLGALGFDVITRIPDRHRDGYGLSPRAVEDLKARGAGLLVTVDCGVSDLEAIETANALDLPVVVTDHH